MPDPLLFLQSLTAASGASAIFVLALAFARNRWKRIPEALTDIPGLIAGLSVGYAVLGLTTRWPPANALDRFLIIVLPSALGVELLSRMPNAPRWMIWLLRTLLAAITARILLHGSVYLDPAFSEWSSGQTYQILGLCGGAQLVHWALLLKLSERRLAATIPLTLGLSILCAGTAMMLAGYLKGGSAALPLTGAICGVCVAGLLTASYSPSVGCSRNQTLTSIGILRLYSLLFIGRFFGALTTERAILIFLAPMSCWITELPWLRRLRSWQLVAIRLLAPGLTLLTAMIPAWRDFEQRMGTLLDR